MSRPDLLARLAQAQAARAEAGLLRRLRGVDAVDGAYVLIGGRRLLNFASNDYLGLAQHPRLREALVDAAQRWGVGATAAHLLGGHRAPHEELEQALADWTGRERALLFSSGYLANIGVLVALLRDGDLCLQDKLNHACLIDGARLSGATLKRYVHADVASARRQLDAMPDAAALLATDGVFSMDGDVAPLAELAVLCRARGATLHVDDAHGLGVLGRDGAGSLAEAGLDQDAAPVLMATLGKALGCAGAFIAGSANLIDGLVQFARSHVYTTAMPPAVAAAALVAVNIARYESWRRDRLQILIAHLRDGAAARGLPLLPSRSAIQPLRVGDSETALRLSRALEARGVYVPAIRPPTVPAGTARLRITLSALHSEAMVEQLLDTVQAVQKT
ncbi:MAG: 8-amino-7-oxononanoate synthase [Lysobacterales bacterium 69-70]|nr:8-amino-7-oxononanoate synthase [Xanthomonadaceae bacterium]ODU31112.1 MAG: 8-amino-7-oxononanoate synthase [Xanthomonadaceae bacterium SCN 69-320]ODV20723.1 MAG: 8-amino-7-oxononanoate synthase [Xanthomonadaceae bacterium SCN 69-25]OJY98701.1 MAG: 8-amino-7-oxononanoate synthase [Xanthomonadales bacterium 69-70]